MENISKDLNINAVPDYDTLQTDVELHFPKIIGRENKFVNILLIGAWRGDEIHSFLRWKNLGEIFAFEPNPAEFEYLKKSFKDRMNIRLFPFACSDTNGEAELHISSLTGTDSLLPFQKHEMFQQIKSTRVKTCRLDSVPELMEETFDLLWIDVQGFEYAVFNGAHDTLLRTNAIFTEINLNEETYKGATQFPVLHELLTKLGFYLVATGAGNAFYLKNSLSTDFFNPDQIHARSIQTAKILKRRYFLLNNQILRFVFKKFPIPFQARMKALLRSF